MEWKGFRWSKNDTERGLVMQLKENLKDAYFCKPKCKDQRKYVKFQYKGHMIHYKKKTAILAGIRFKTFTKIMTPTIALLRHIGV